nr:NADPH-dependent glutamate synthase [Baileyella intestinalis]
MNNSKIKTPMPSQDPNVRNSNFQEVALGYTEEMAVSEAERCLNCKNKPCVSGCPVNVRIPEFIKKVTERKFEEAYEIITSTNSLPAVCGRVCPQETQCEGRCVRGIKGEPVGVGRLERFVADWHREHQEEEKNNVSSAKESNKDKRVAVVGSGPAGLACAGDLINMGYDVTVFESLHKEGGVLVYGIPEFRLPKDIVAYEIDNLKAKGVKFIRDVVIGRSLNVDDLFDQGYQAVFIGTGAGLPRFMNIEGENLVGVYSANEYLTRINLMKAYKDEYDTPIKKHKKVAVVGGGNVAMDAARCAKRMGADVHIVYRRGRDEMPARAEEIQHAEEEGIVFHLLNNPVRILGDDKNEVEKIECIKMELGEPDASGRRRPVPIQGSEFTIDVDAVIMALGTRLNNLICDTTEGLDQNDRGGIKIDEENNACTRPGVFAGGDAVTGAATVIKAMGAGKKGAAGIDAYLNK